MIWPLSLIHPRLALLYAIYSSNNIFKYLYPPFSYMISVSPKITLWLRSQSMTFNIHHSNHIRQRGEYNNQRLIHTHVFFTDQIFMGPNIFIFLLEYFLIFTLYHRHVDGVTWLISYSSLYVNQIFTWVSPWLPPTESICWYNCRNIINILQAYFYHISKSWALNESYII